MSSVGCNLGYGQNAAYRDEAMNSKFALAILFAIVAGASFGATSNGLPFTNNDFPKALKEAKQRNIPAFVEVWAPW